MNDALIARRRLLAVAAAFALLSEVFAWSGVGVSVHETLFTYVKKGDGFFSACFLASAVIFAASRPQNLRAFLGAGIVGELVQAMFRGHNDYLHNAGAMFGVVALVFAGWDVVLTRSDDAKLVFCEVLMWPALLLAAVLPLELTVTLHPTTLDGRAFLLDETLFGGQPAWAVGRWFAASRATLIFEALVYIYLPVAAAGVYVLDRRAERKSDLQVAFLVIGIIGILALHLAPIAGPNSFRPHYPQTLPPTDIAVQSLYVAGTRWRNCIPSMHTTWALLIYWHARHHGLRARIFGIVWVVTTIVAMLGLGEHFLVDVAVTIPFAVAMRAIFLRSATPRTRLHAAAGGLAVFTLWMLLLRGPTSLLGDPWLMRPFAFAGVAGALFLETRLVPGAETPAPLFPLAIGGDHVRRIAFGFWLGAFALAVSHWVGFIGLALAFGLAGEALGLAAAGVGVLVAAYALFPSIGILAGGIVVFMFSGFAIRFRKWGEKPPEPFARPSMLIVAAAVVCGVIAVLERHVLVLLAGSSAYAHAAMTAAGLFGLALGARVRIPRPWALSGVAVSCVLVGFAWPSVPAYFAGFHDFVERPTFASSELARFTVIALLVLVPATFAGAALTRGGFSAAGGGAIGAVLATLFLGHVGLGKVIDVTSFAGGENVYFAKQGYGSTIAVADDAHGWTTVTQAADRKAILANGKFVADDKADGFDAAQKAFAELALLHAKGRASALVFGVGTGASVAALGIPDVKVVDPAPGAEQLANQFFGASVHVSGTDPLAALSEGPFDVIAWETPTMWTQGAAHLYSLDTYERARNALRPGGVFQQWLQLHRLERTDLGAFFFTLHRRLPKIWLYVAERQGIVIACADACEPAHADPRLVLDPAGVERFLATVPTDQPLTSDYTPWLELHAARTTMRPYESSLRENEELLETFAKP